jgi:iron complex outermembrane receptor protein
LWKGATVKAAYFENYLSDLIYRNTITPTLQQYVNVGGATIKGVEAGVEQRFADWLRLFGSLTWNDARVTKNDAKPQIVGARLTYMPEWLASLGADFTMGPFSAYLIGRYASKVFQDDQNRDTVNNVYGTYDPYWLADATLSFNIMKWAKISFSVNNIFDENYFYYYKTPGRSWFGELTLQY